MSGLQVNTGDMNNSGKETVANAEYFSNELSSLKNNIDGLMGIWRGISATEFKNSYQEQANNLEAFRKLLNDLGEGISSGARILNDAEEENAADANRLFQ